MDNIDNITAVAIDRDKSSQMAVKWAIDHLLTNNPSLLLIHVRIRHLHSQTLDATTEANRDQNDSDMEQFFLPFRGFCARKRVAVKEVVLEDTDVTTALVQYIDTHLINAIVVGASARNAFTRRFRHTDVASSLTKSAPQFCAVYVISKGKALNVRSANRPVLNTATPPKQTTPIIFPPYSNDNDDSLVKTPFGKESQIQRGVVAPERRSMERSRTPPTSRERPLSTAKTVPPIVLMDTYELQNTKASCSREVIYDDIDFSSPLGFGSCDINAEDLELSLTSESPRVSLSSPFAREIEAEMKRLKLELKQTFDMYSTACKEAISAKQKAKELHQWRIEEARKFEQARLAEETALAIAEVEKAKCKAAIEAATAAQRLAEMEAQRRKNAEMKAKLEAAEKKRALDVLAHNDVRYRKYTIEDIETATECFSDSLKIGEGGYGPVYRGTLDHTPVAIKVLRPDAAQGRKQFQQEVEVLSCIRHPNMVLLLGACPEFGCLVYEYMDNGSLDDRLFRRGNTPPIPWRIRFKIAAEIATGLLFLHQSKPEPLVHRDLKPANILIDRNYVSKISDVGLARLVPPHVADSVTQYHLTSAAGTFCYIDPEYQQTGLLGTKSDIYSLGVMLLQIITAKPPMGLTHHVSRAIDKGNFAEMIDPAVSDWPLEDTLSYAKLALKCSELRRKDRPDLGSVILPELNRLRNLRINEASSSITFGYRLHSNNTSSSSSSRPRRFSSAIQEPLKSSPNARIPHTSAFEEGGRHSSPRAINEVRRPAPKNLTEYHQGKQ